MQNNISPKQESAQHRVTEDRHRFKRRVGALLSDRGVEFCVWAPELNSVDVVFADGGRHPLEKGDDGFFSALVKDAKAGTRYKFAPNGGADAFPDPASRFQPEGPHKWSEVTDSAAYAWSENEKSWKGRELKGQVIYEFHVGTFTEGGTYRSAAAEFERLRELGITVLELMPVNQFAGEHGWGYDGVDMFAPHHAYGTPDDLRWMIDKAHQSGLSVILDVVYNHFGPDGNYLAQFSRFYVSGEESEWGAAPNFDGENSGPVREFFLQNVEMWIRDFHFDGLRFDATQAICDNGTHGRHILAEMSEIAHEAAGERKIILVSECERQWSDQLVPVAAGGKGLHGMWNDDLHHSAVVRLTGKREAYYCDHPARAQEFVSAAKYGFLYQGQFYSWQMANRGTPFPKLEPWQPITFLENHDQVANNLLGTRPRAHSSPRMYRAMCGYWLLSTGTPMFFQGQEYGSTRHFVYFCDHESGLCSNIRTGRTQFLSQFESIAKLENAEEAIADPGKEDTFLSSKLMAEDRETEEAKQLQAMFADLLRIRREDPVINDQCKGCLDGAVLSEDAFILRYFAKDQSVGDRMVVTNFGRFLELVHLPEPLLAPPAGMEWEMVWNSEHLEYGGSGAMNPVAQNGWHVAEEATILLRAVPIAVQEEFHTARKQ